MTDTSVHREGWLWRAVWKGELVSDFFTREADAWAYLRRLMGA